MFTIQTTRTQIAKLIAKNSLLVFLVISVSVACSRVNDWQRDGLKGEVRSVFVQQYEASKKRGGWVQGRFSEFAKTYYSKDGMKTSGEFGYETDYGRSGTGEFTVEGNLTTRNSEENNVNGTLYRLVTKFARVSDDRVEWEVVAENGEIVDTGFRVDDFSKGHIVQTTFSTGRISKFFYDELDNPISSEHKAEKETTVRKYEILKSDEFGNWTEMVTRTF